MRMASTLPIVMLVLFLIARNRWKAHFANKRGNLFHQAYVDQKHTNDRALAVRTYGEGSEQDDLAKAVYLENLAKSAGAKHEELAIQRNLSRWTAVLQFFTRRWAGFGNVFTALDIVVVATIVATLSPGMLHEGVDMLHGVGTWVVDGVGDVASNAIPWLQELLREDILGGSG